MTLAQKKIIPAHTPVDFPALLERVHVIGSEVIAPAAVEVDRDARFPHESFAALRAEKLLSCYVPVEFGGMGLDIVQVSRICEALISVMGAAHSGVNSFTWTVSSGSPVAYWSRYTLS